LAEGVETAAKMIWRITAAPGRIGAGGDGETGMGKSGSQKSKSPSELIGARIKELGDWREKIVSGPSSRKPIPTSSRSGNGEGFRCGRTRD
jgi:hypothetical protein